MATSSNYINSPWGNPPLNAGSIDAIAITTQASTTTSMPGNTSVSGSAGSSDWQDGKADWYNSLPTIIKTLFRLGLKRNKKKSSVRLDINTAIEISNEDLRTIIDNEDASKVDVLLNKILEKVQKDWLDSIKAKKILHKLLSSTQKQQDIVEYKGKIKLPYNKITKTEFYESPYTTIDSTTQATTDTTYTGTYTVTSANFGYNGTSVISQGNLPGTYSVSWSQS